MRTGSGTAPGPRPRPGAAPARAVRRGAPAVLLLLLAIWPASLRADPDYQGPLLYGLDPVLRSTDDPRLLGVRREVLRDRLLRLGVDPLRDAGASPTLRSALRRSWDERSNVDLERVERLTEFNGPMGTLTEIEYPTFLFLFPPKEDLPGGFTYFPPRRTGDPDVRLFVDDLDEGITRRHRVAMRTGRMEALDVVGGGQRPDEQEGLINLTIPVKLPRTLEKIIGRGEKTNIRITGRSRIAITGESTVTKPFLGNERVQSQSLFPTLDMEQELQVNLSGTIGEKIIIEVDHNSAAIGPEATKIKLMYQGDEDEIIRTIETGDVGLTLPGAQLLGYNSNKSGLFGIKVTGQVGPAEFTVVASKQKAETSSQTFSSKGGQISEHVTLSSQYIRNRFFRLTSEREQNRVPMAAIDVQSIRIYQKVQAIGNVQPGELVNVAAFTDTTGLWQPDTLSTPDVYGARWRQIYPDPERPDMAPPVLIDANTYVWGVDLGYDVGDDAVLACTYEYLATDGRVRVGDDPNTRTHTIVDNGQPVEGAWTFLKLLKLPMTDPNPWIHALMIRQIYSLGGGNIAPDSFNMRIERNLNVDLPQFDENGVSYLRIFGLDNGDNFGNGEPDDRPDIDRDTLFDLQRGLLVFPEDFARPFDATEEQYRANAAPAEIAWGPEVFLTESLSPILYRPGATPVELQSGDRFRLVSEHASASNTISLNTSNIEEGSEVVKVDGQTLVRDQDYDIDYSFGEITLKEGNFTLTADSQITVSYQFAPFVGGGNTSLLGANVAYDLGEGSNLSTTWLYETENIVGEKAKLGEEPSKTLVGNVNVVHTERPNVLTKVANLVSRRDTERDSELTFSGEMAVSMPNPNTKDNAYLEDFEGVDASNIVTLSRTAWTLPSAPISGSDGTAANPVFTPEQRVSTIRWFLPKERVLRRYLNPDLVNQERDETQQTMDLFLRKDDGTWDADDWGGILRGVSSTGLDLTRAQFVEVWVNDGQQNKDQRTGRLHIDFGLISEDGYWPEDEQGNPVYNTQQDEDANSDKIFTQDEDTGLGGIPDANPYDPTYGSANDPYPDINSTRANNEWDIEDANRNGSFERDNEYFSTVIDLHDTPALVDVVEDYTNLADLPADQAWRKYRIPLSAVLPVSATGFDPALTRVRHVRIWFEDDRRTSDRIKLQLSELRFLGSRWEREGMRDAATEDLLLPGDRLAGESFFLGEVNTKENPDYVPPYAVRVENGIPEKEQALSVAFADLDRGHLLRTSKQVSVSGDDYTNYTDLSWFWYNPSHTTADLDLFFRVGSDTLNFYEVRYRFAEGNQKTGWKAMIVNLADLSNVKNGTEDVDGNLVGQVKDSRTQDAYDVRVVGRPDLRKVKRYYFVVANNAVSLPVSGRFYLDDVRLLGVKREKGFAERAGVRMNMADVFKLDFDWNHQDSEFHGLDKTRGSGVDNTNWNLGMNFAVEDFVPLLGFKLPVSLNRRQVVQRPKYELSSDIEIQDEGVRNALSTIETREGFSTRLSHPGSKSALLRYLVDPWTFSLNGSRTAKDDPLQENDAKNLQGNVAYDLRINSRPTLSGLPLVGKVPVASAVVLVPQHLGVTGNFKNEYSATVSRDREGTVVQRSSRRNKPLGIAATMDYEPLSVMSTSFTANSARDQMREQHALGLNVGEENLRSYGVRLTFNPPRPKQLPSGTLFRPVRFLVRQINATRPSVQFTGGFEDNHSPDVRREGDPENVRSVNNNGNWELRFNLPLGDAAKELFPEKRYSDSERQRLLREQQALADRAARRGEADQTVELTEDETAGLTPDQIQELRERKLLEAAQARQEEEEALRRQREALEPGGGLGIPNPLSLVLTTLRNMQPLKVTFTDKRASAYTRLRSDVPFWYKTGLASALDTPDSLFVSYSESDRQTMDLAVTTKMHRNVAVDIKFNETNSRRDQIGTVTRGFQQQWPDGQVSLSGLERWPIFGGGNRGGDEGWFRSSNLSLSYRRTKMANNITEDFYNPQITTTLSPRLTATFHSGLTATASVNRTSDSKVNVGSTQENRRTRFGLTLRHQFRAQGFLARLGLYRPGSNPTITMDVDISYDKDRSQRIDSTGQVGSETGNNRIGVNPRFSYNISRNLTGAARLIYGRTSNIQTGQTTTNLGLGLEVTFVF